MVAYKLEKMDKEVGMEELTHRTYHKLKNRKLKVKK